MTIPIKMAALELALIMQNKEGLDPQAVKASIEQKIVGIKSAFDNSQWPRVISMVFGALVEKEFDLAEVSQYCQFLEPLDEFSRMFNFDAVSRLCSDQNIVGLREEVQLYPATELGELHQRLT